MFRCLIIIFLLTFTGISTGNAQIVALGASNTAGYGVGASSAYPAQLEQILSAKGRPMSVTNAGISGDTTGGMLARLSSAVPAGTKIVILQIGGNDASWGQRCQERNGPRQRAGKQSRNSRAIARPGYSIH